MVVTDLHGDWELYQRYRDHFLRLKAAGEADILVFTGDLIHLETPDMPDQSLDIVSNVRQLQAQYGDAIIYLLGNHELVHIYGIPLSKGERTYTPEFEAALTRSGQRDEIIAFFDSLPFFVRTQAGISLTHAGANAAFPDFASQLFHWDHQAWLEQAKVALAAEKLEVLRQNYAHQYQMPYEMIAKHFLAVTGPDDSRYDDLLRGYFASNNRAFQEQLWPTFFTRCEYEYSRYDRVLDAMLQSLSVGYTSQQILVAGHIQIRRGYNLIAKRHLRLASGCHADPAKSRVFLRFDAATPPKKPKTLYKNVERL